MVGVGRVGVLIVVVGDSYCEGDEEVCVVIDGGWVGSGLGELVGRMRRGDDGMCILKLRRERF